MMINIPHLIYHKFIKIVLCIFFILYLVSILTLAQPLHEDKIGRLLGGPTWSEANSIERTDDSGYIIIGTISPTNTSEEKIWLIKTNSSGQEQWNRTLGLPGSNFGHAVIQTPDRGYLVAGVVAPEERNSLNILLIKTNITGYLEWDKVFNKSGWNDVHALNITNEGNYILLGENGSTDREKSNVLLICVAPNGNELWNKSFNNSGYSIGQSILQTNTGFIILGANGFDGDGKPNQLLAIKTDFNGNELNRTILFKEMGRIIPLGVCNAENNTYTSLLMNRSSSGAKETFLINTWGNWTKRWIRSLGRHEDDVSPCLIRIVDDKNHNNSYAIAGGTSTSGNGSIDVFLAKANQSGLIWSQVLGGRSYDISRSLVNTPDGGYIIVGATGSYGSYPINAWLLKVDSLGKEKLNRTYGLNITRSINTTFEDYNATAINIEKRYISPFLNGTILLILKPLLIIIGVSIIVILIYKLIQNLIAPKRQIFVENFINASANESLKDVLPGLSDQMREKLLKNLESIQKFMKKHGDELVAGISKRPPEFFFVPKEAEAAPVKELMESLKDAAPAEAKPLIPILSFIYPKPSGYKVNCTLQGHKDQSELLGITSKLVNLEYPPRVAIQTFWEKISKKESICITDPNKIIESLRNIAIYLEDAGLFSDALKYREEALKMDKSETSKMDPNKDSDESEKIARLADKQKITDLSRTYYELAKKNRDNWNISKIYYIKSLNYLGRSPPLMVLYNSTLTPLQIRTVCFDIAYLYYNDGMLDEALELAQFSEEKGYNATDIIAKIKKKKIYNLSKTIVELRNLCRFSEAKGYLQAILVLSPQNKEAKSSLKIVEAELTKNEKPYERYRELLRLASWWQAIEIIKWAMLDYAKDDDKFCQAGIYLSSGLLKLCPTLMDTFPELYEMSKEDIEKSRSICKDWYRPYEFLGGLLINQSKVMPESEAVPKIKSAVLNYEKALTQLNSDYFTYVYHLKKYSYLGSPSKYSYLGSPCNDCRNQEKENKDLTIKYLESNLAIAEFLCGVLSTDSTDKKLLERIERHSPIKSISSPSEHIKIPIDLLSLSVPDPNGFSDKGLRDLCTTTTIESNIRICNVTQKIKDHITKVKSAKAIYNLACLIGLAVAYYDRGGNKLIENKVESINDARGLLIYSLALDRYKDIWDLASKDPDLKEIVDNDMVERIKYELSCYEIDKNQKLQDLMEDRKEFDKKVDKIIELIKYMKFKFDII